LVNKVEQLQRGRVTGEPDGVQRLGLLASAIGGRPLAVAACAPGEQAWTDGKTIFVDASSSVRDQVESLAVQASLLAGGGLEAGVVRRLVRRRQAVVDRYLAVEAHRALEANKGLLPDLAVALIDADIAGRTTCPTESLELAAGREVPVALPASFGAIRVRKLLAATRATSRAEGTGRHVPRPHAEHELPELDDDADEEPVESTTDPFSSPVGGGGPLGKLLQRLMSKVRKLDGNGSPGAHAPTHRRRSTSRAAGAVASMASAAVDTDPPGDMRSQGVTYPEWDVRRHSYRQHRCTVHETAASDGGESWSAAPDGHALRRALTRLGMGLDRFHRQPQGDDVDIDAAVESRVEMMAGAAPDDAVYVDSLRRRRDLSVLLLLDVSGSAAEAATLGQTVHEQQRWAAAALAAALHELGDRVALYAFRSHGRTDVQMIPVKRFDDRLNAAVMRRLYGLTPGAYSRLGAAIRHGSEVLRGGGGTPRRLLVVLSDGLAYDHGYERAYGAADARRALAEANRLGIGCLCLTMGAGTDAEELRRVFGTAAHATVPTPEQLSRVIGPLFRTALNRADLRRRLA
jgi:nitric oxide reductase NorD protein